MKASDLAKFRWFTDRERKLGEGFHLYCEMPTEAGQIINMCTANDTLYVLCENGLYVVEEGRATKVDMHL